MVIPELFGRFFPSWFAGVAFAAIVIGALVPAAIMAIGAANLFASNILRSFQSRTVRPPVETSVARYLALLVLAGAFVLAVFIRPDFSINFQLLGGAWVLQIFPSVILGLYARRLHPVALLTGWAAGMTCATWMVASSSFKSVFALHVGGGVLAGAAMFYALLLNLAVTLALSAALQRGTADRFDAICAADPT